jgi:hypothetical protein
MLKAQLDAMKLQMMTLQKVQLLVASFVAILADLDFLSHACACCLHPSCGIGWSSMCAVRTAVHFIIDVPAGSQGGKR